MAVASASYRGGALPQPDSSNSLLSVEDGIATISIEGPILRKPGLFARVIMGATDSEEIGAAIREANDRADINKWGQSSRIHIRLVLLCVMEYARAWQDLQDSNIPGRFTM